MYKSDQERIVTVVLAAHIALQSSHQFSKIIILKSPPLQKDLLVILLSYLYWNISSLLVNQLHCHSHKHQTPAISSSTHARTSRTHAYSSQHSLQISQCISILFNNITQYYCFFNITNLPQGVESRECWRWLELGWRCCTRVGWRETKLGS